MMKFRILALGTAIIAAASPALAAQSPSDPLVGRAWVETKPQNGLPGVMLVFLADGTLLIDSCWETYALRKWTRTSKDEISWDEDGARITAKVQAVSQSQLALRVKAGRDLIEHRYTAGKVPFVCPEMKR